MPERKNVIVICKDNEPVYVFGGIVDMCRKMPGFNYNYLKGKNDFPYSYKGYVIYKMKFR